MTNREPKPVSKEGPARPGIDRDSFEPIYYQLANILRRQIATGILLPGDRVPSETQICEQYEVSPMTARRALMTLLDDGLVTAERGRGTFVKPLVLGAATFGLEAFEDLFSDEATLVRFLLVKTVPATPRISRRLAVPTGSKVISIRRLLLRDVEPVAFHREFLIFDPLMPIVEAEMGITNLQGLFDGTGETMLKRGDLRIQTTVLIEEEADLLDTPVGSAAFRIEHTFYDFGERPVSWGWFIVPGKHLQFNATVGAQPVAM
jgi:GntR family transcriptional regulator